MSGFSSVYDLPETVEVAGTAYQVRTDYRCVLDIFEILTDPEFTNWEKARAAMEIFYFSPGYKDVPPSAQQEAVDQMMWFISGGEEPKPSKKEPALVNWKQDFRIIAAPISRVYGRDIRAVPYDPETNAGGLHWWSFLGCYMEIGDCLFAQVVRVRDRRARGKSLDKADREFYRRNQELVDIKTQYTHSEDAFFKEWAST